MKILTASIKQLCIAANKQAEKQLGRDLAEIVQLHSGAAAAAGLASGWIPGAGAAAATAVAAGSIWSMYGRINGALGLSIGDNIMKTLAAGVATNLASSVIAGLALGTFFSLFPGIGSIPAAIAIGGTIYSLTVASGIVYLNVLTEIFNSGVNPNQCSEEDLKNMANDVISDIDIEAIKKEAKKSYKNSKKN